MFPGTIHPSRRRAVSPWALVCALMVSCVAGLAPAAAQTTPRVAFKSTTPKNVTEGTTTSIGFDVFGTMPANADVLVLAWHHDQRRVIDAFSHIVKQRPWRIEGASMAKIPAGNVELQLHTRVDGQPVRVIKRNITVQPARVAEPGVLPRVMFPANTPNRISRGSSPDLRLNLTGPMPPDGDLLVLAWSDGRAAMVNEFAFTLTEGPFVISGKQLDMLPGGQVELQVLGRIDGKIRNKTVRRVTVAVPKPTVNAEPTSTAPTGGGTANTSTPAPTPVIEDAPASSDPPTPIVAVPSPATDLVVSLNALPTDYTRGSDTRIDVALNGTLPSDGDILMIAWHVDQKRVIDAFAHTLVGGDRRVKNGMLDKLPAGTVELQAHLRLPGQDPLITKREFAVVVPAGQETVDDTPVTFDPPVAAAGFTTFSASGDTRTIYVSSSAGNDLNSGLSPQAPVKTASRGKELLRDGYPDWLLFKAGDTFSGGLGNWTKSGRSDSAKMLVGVYGDGARPKFKTYGDNGVNCYEEVNHVAFVGLEFWPAKRDPDSSDYNYNQIPWGEAGVVWFSGGEDVLFEDCKFTYYANNLVFQAPAPGDLQNVQVRRCIIMNSYRHWDKNKGGGHSQGIYMDNVRDTLIEGCFFDHNGWNDRVSGASRTKFNHNIYHQRTNQGTMVFRGNYIARGGSHGLQARSGGLVEDNLFVRNAIGFFVARDPSVARRNVVLMSNDINSTDVRGYGIHVLPCEDAKIEQNIVAHKEGSADWAGAIEATDEPLVRELINQNRIAVNNNIVYRWTSSFGAIRKADGDSTFTQNGNLVDKFSGGSGDPPFVDPDRTVETYLASQGRSQSLDEMAHLGGNRGRNTWDDRWTASGVNNYIRAGFEFLPFD